jgi:hypothetical protein
MVGGGLVKLSGPGTWTGGTNVGNFGSGTLRVMAPGAIPAGNILIQNNSSAIEFAVPGAATFGNTFQGSGTVRQLGPGTVLLNGASTNYFGTLEVASGTLQAGGVNSLGNGSTVQVLSGAILEMATNDSLSGSGVIIVNSGATLNAAGFQQNTPVWVNNAGSVTLPAGSVLTLGGNSTWTGSSTGAGNLSVASFTTYNTGANLQHTGGTTVVTNGYMQINTSNILPDTGLLHVNGGTVQHSATDTVDNVQVDAGNLSASTLTTNALNVQGGNVSGTTITANGAFTKTGPGTATVGINTLNLLAGGTISAGQLDVNGGVVNGSIVNNATLKLNFSGTANGPTTNNGTIDLENNGTLAGATTNAGNININGGNVSGTVGNAGAINAQSGTLSADVSGAGTVAVNSGFLQLTGTNTYTGGSTVTNGQASGDTDSIQGNWVMSAGLIDFNQNFAGTMAGQISGTGFVQLGGPGPVTLTGNNSFSGGVGLFGIATHFGIGSNTAAGVGGPISGNDYKLSAEGGARTVANQLMLGASKTEFTGSNNLTFTDTTAKNLTAGAEIKHTSTASTIVAGTFLGQNTATINVTAGSLTLGAAINNGFRMDGDINVASGATLQMVSNSLVKLGPTNLTGGTLIAANGVAVPTGLALNAAGSIQGRVASEAGSVIEATGPLTMGDVNSFAGYFSNGELREESQGVTILDKNQAVLGSLSEVGNPGVPGTLNIANGAFVDFGAAITGFGQVNSTNNLAQATVINGSAAGLSNSEPLDFTGYVKGVGDFTDVTFSGTFSPGLSPAITAVNNVNFGPSSTLLIEIGGLSPGSQHDQLAITGNLGLNGTLDVDLIMGFNPSLGNSFLILNGPTTGAFSGFQFPALNAGLMWSTANLYTQGRLDIVQVPEPSTLILAGVAAVAMTIVAGQRKKTT